MLQRSGQRFFDCFEWFLPRLRIPIRILPGSCCNEPGGYELECAPLTVAAAIVIFWVGGILKSFICRCCMISLNFSIHGWLGTWIFSLALKRRVVFCWLLTNWVGNESKLPLCRLSRDCSERCFRVPPRRQRVRLWAGFCLLPYASLKSQCGEGKFLAMGAVGKLNFAMGPWKDFSNLTPQMPCDYEICRFTPDTQNNSSVPCRQQVDFWPVAAMPSKNPYACVAH